jgi:ATP-dependent Clp protease ATP-binding subunit ClpX
VSTEQLLATLPLISRSSAQTSDFLITSVGVLRSRKASWAKIGRSLGVSWQAAWERFHRNFDEAPVSTE